MVLIKAPKSWEISENLVTPEHIFFNRRKFFKRLGVLGIGAGILGCIDKNGKQVNAETIKTLIKTPSSELFPKPQNTKFVLDRPLTDEKIAATYNNFYEFTTDKEKVWELAKNLKTRPWTVEVSGEIRKGGTFGIDDLMKKLPMEERLYRHRCVEAWAMAVPWTGIPMSEFLKMVEPTEKAKFLKFTGFFKPLEAEGQKNQPWYTWPYYEGMQIEEANNPLTLLATGIYGKELPPQHGSPIRIVTPWKYGFKSIKSITKIEFVEKQPQTFWNDLAPEEYDFLANVNPKIPHPRWSQETEKMLGTDEKRETLLFNGYEEFVKHLYN
ncbi:protein-methionine-sulfoxide reductase catalytic subunit MsrP [bacterium]|nr:protein-methionine-sulfoxide reductase catalytic subunit MsrP [bacterium]